jgi:mannose-1-phosphate guanylyltransferase / mannose-6-phosphate isomerase
LALTSAKKPKIEIHLFPPSLDSHDNLPLILSGGSGTRLWPLSCEQYPTQLLPLVGDESLLQATARWLDAQAGLLEPLLVCNEEHRFVVAEQLRLLRKQAALLLEPVGRITAPALAITALWALRDGGPVMVVMPADHVILDGTDFRDAVA